MTRGLSAALVLVAIGLWLRPVSSQGFPSGIPKVASLPAACSPSGTTNVVFKTSATIGLYQCLTANIWTAVGGGGGGTAPADATYVTQTANSGLSAEQALAALSTGLMFVTTTTGAVTSVVPGTGVVTALGTNVGSAGAFMTFNGAIGTSAFTALTGGTITSRLVTNGSTPAVTDTTADSCGSGTQTIVGNDNAGKVTVIGSGGTSCTVTFATGFTNAPSCTVTNETTAALVRATSSTAAVIISGVFLQNDVLAYACLGR